MQKEVVGKSKGLLWKAMLLAKPSQSASSQSAKCIVQCTLPYARGYGGAVIPCWDCVWDLKKETVLV